MKPVLHIVPALFGDDGGIVGGAERYAWELARQMAIRTETTLVSFGAAGKEWMEGPLRVRVIGGPWYVRGQRTNPVKAALIGEVLRARAVHCHQRHVLASSVAALVCRLTGRKVFVSDLGGGGWDISAYVSTERWYHGHLHISEYSRMISGHISKPWAKVIYGGVDTEKFAPAKQRGPRENVLFVGRLMPHKGVDDLIQGLPEDMALEIVGRPYDERYAEDLRKLAEGKRVTFHSDCGDDRLVKAYQRALCVVLPSVYKDRYGSETRVPELLGQTLLEAMACGTPAICTDVASMPEVVRDGETGFIVPPNDPEALGAKLTWLRDHPEEAASMGANGRLRIERSFAWPAVVEHCLDAYEACGSRAA